MSRLAQRMSAHALAAAMFAAGSPALAFGPRLDSPDAVARAVLMANPELAALEDRLRAVEHAVPQAGVWPDPVLSIEDSNAPLDAPYPGSHPMAGVQFRLQQTFPFPGKTSSRTAVAESRVTGVREELSERRNRLDGNVRDLYHRLALVRQLRQITERHIAVVGELIGAVRARYETGGAPQHDLLQLQILHERLRDDLEEFSRADREITAGLLATLHVSPDVPIETPEITPLPPAPSPLDVLVARAAQDRPLLQQLAAQARTASLAAGRAETEKRPDITFWLGYRYRRPVGSDLGQDLYSVGFSIPLPWFWNGRRWDELAEQERAQARSFDEERAARLDEIRGRLDAALARFRRANQKVHVYEDELVPGQREALESALASYRVGRAEFATLYGAELQLLDFERSIRGASAEAARAAVEIHLLAGDYVGAPGKEEQR